MENSFGFTVNFSENLKSDLIYLDSIKSDNDMLVKELFKFINVISSESIYCRNGVEKANPIESTNLLLKAFGNPEKCLNIIKVVGTNGKGSSSNFLNQILLHNNLNVGIYTSPHIINFEERIRFNNKDINLFDLIKLMKTVYYKGKEIGIDNCGFPLVMTICAVIYFKEQNVDFAIFEAGVGGLIDPINALPSSYGIITNVGIDHLGLLGDSLESIRKHKFGIIKNNTKIFSSCSEIDNYILENNLENVKFINSGDKENFSFAINGFNSQLNTLLINFIELNPYNKKLHNINLKMLGEYQVNNLLNVLNITYEINNDFNLKLTDELIINGIEDTLLKGRLELYNNNLFLDGSHNELGINTLIETFKNNFSNRKIKILTSFKKGKDYETFLNKFKTISPDIYLVDINNLSGKYFSDLSEVTSDYLIDNDIIYLKGDCKKAFDIIYNSLSEDEVLLVTGSLYLMSEIHIHLENIKTK